MIWSEMTVDYSWDQSANLFIIYSRVDPMLWKEGHMWSWSRWSWHTCRRFWSIHEENKSRHSETYNEYYLDHSIDRSTRKWGCANNYFLVWCWKEEVQSPHPHFAVWIAGNVSSNWKSNVSLLKTGNLAMLLVLCVCIFAMESWKLN